MNCNNSGKTCRENTRCRPGQAKRDPGPIPTGLGFATVGATARQTNSNSAVMGPGVRRDDGGGR